MNKEIISTKDAPAAVGPYSQAVKVGDLVYTAGQIPLDPATSKLAPGDIAAQTDRVMQNLHAVLTAAGSSLDNVVKTTIFLTDMGHYRTVNEVYGRYMANNPPARSAIQVAALPLGALIEIEMVAVVGD